MPLNRMYNIRDLLWSFIQRNKQEAFILTRVDGAQKIYLYQPFLKLAESLKYIHLFTHSQFQPSPHPTPSVSLRTWYITHYKYQEKKRPGYGWLHLACYIIGVNYYFEHIAFKADPCLNHSSCSDVEYVNTFCNHLLLFLFSYIPWLNVWFNGISIVLSVLLCNLNIKGLPGWIFVKPTMLTLSEGSIFS